jgi:hypothetical protein
MENTGSRSQIEEIRALRRQIRIWTPSLVVVLAVVVLVCVLVIWNAVSSLARQGDRQDQFVEKLGGRMQNDILPLVQDVGEEALSSIDFNEEIRQLNARAPEVASAGLEQLRLLGTNNLDRGKEVLTEEFDRALKDREAILREEFPDASEEQIAGFLADLTRETQVQLAEYLDMLFSPHLATMNSMIDDLELIQASEGPVGTSEIPTWEMAFLIVDIARADLEVPYTDDDVATAGKGESNE